MSVDRLYSRTLNAAPTLSADEQHELARRYARDRDPRDARRLMLANLKLVVSIANSMSGAWHPDAMDLVQEGNAGLIVAIERFDPARGTKLATYAGFWIRAFIMRHLMESGRMVRSTSTREGRRRFFDRALPRDLSLDAPIGHGGAAKASGPSFLDSVPADAESRPDVAAETREEHERLRAAVSALEQTLTARERVILKSRLLCDSPEPLRQLGPKLSLSGERVRQLEQHMLDRLRVLVASAPTEALGRAA
jgi:RNA polymerase sigma-32 factor